jgi:hypothetical protein
MISEGEREAQNEGKWTHCASEIDVAYPMRNILITRELLDQKTAQHSEHPTGGIRPAKRS